MTDDNPKKYQPRPPRQMFVADRAMAHALPGMRKAAETLDAVPLAIGTPKVISAKAALKRAEEKAAKPNALRGRPRKGTKK